jgi:hypothetical protein
VVETPEIALLAGGVRMPFQQAAASAPAILPTPYVAPVYPPKQDRY